MKLLKCHKCSCGLGEMIKGKIHKDSVLLCAKCYDALKTLYDLDSYKKGTSKNDMPDFFKDIMDGKIK